MSQLTLLQNRYEPLYNYSDSSKRYIEESIEQEVTKNPIRKYKKKLRKLQEKYKNTRDSETYDKIQLYRKLLKIEENKNSPQIKLIISDTVNENPLTFEQILLQDKSQHEKEDILLEKNRIIKENIEKLLSIQKNNLRKQYKNYKFLKKSLDIWQEKIVKKSKEYRSLLTKQDFPEDIKAMIWNPYLYDKVSEKYKEDNEKKDGYLSSIIEKVNKQFKEMQSNRYKKRVYSNKKKSKL